MKNNIFKYVFGAVLAFTSLNASAALLDGNTVTFQYYYPNLTSPYSNSDNGDYVVGPGVEIANVADNRTNMDISDTNLYMDYANTGGWNGSAFNGFVLTDTFSNIGDFTGLSLDTNMVGLTLANLSFTADSISVDWNGLSFTADTYVSIDIVGNVPEPSILALLGAGLLGLTVVRRKNRA